jgi:hypothetical protein
MNQRALLLLLTSKVYMNPNAREQIDQENQIQTMNYGHPLTVAMEIKNV